MLDATRSFIYFPMFIICSLICKAGCISGCSRCGGLFAVFYYPGVPSLLSAYPLSN